MPHDPYRQRHAAWVLLILTVLAAIFALTFVGCSDPLLDLDDDICAVVWDPEQWDSIEFAPSDSIVVMDDGRVVQFVECL